MPMIVSPHRELIKIIMPTNELILILGLRRSDVLASKVIAKAVHHRLCLIKLLVWLTEPFMQLPRLFRVQLFLQHLGDKSLSILVVLLRLFVLQTCHRMVDDMLRPLGWLGIRNICSHWLGDWLGLRLRLDGRGAYRL
mmetsp:Transcript_10545/g.10620  ORF Transcript_10545/g.10620 Transcript_10545/m.10620 type:complete len:138 (+) Transcript_10545:267-680(+)